MPAIWRLAPVNERIIRLSDVYLMYAECAARIRPMTENRPQNAAQNATAGTRANETYPRVTGAFTGTPASIRDSDVPQTEAMELDPFDSVISETTRMT